MTEIQVEKESEFFSLTILNHFSIIQVIILFGLLILMQVERMLYRMRIELDGGQRDGEFDINKHALAIKASIYAILVMTIHVVLGFTLPLGQNTSLD